MDRISDSISEGMVITPMAISKVNIVTGCDDRVSDLTCDRARIVDCRDDCEFSDCENSHDDADTEVFST